MRYDFDTVIDRRKTDSVKWDDLPARFGVDDALPLWVADMDFAPPPAVKRAVLERAERGLYGYTLRPTGLNDAIVHWFATRHGWQIDPTWLTFTPGVVPAISLAVTAFTQPGDRIIVQPPVYHPFFSVIRDSGRQVVENPLSVANGRYAMDLDGLKSCFDSRTRLVILCSPHNPVGRVWSRDELAAFADECIRHDVIVVSDEIHCDLLLDGARHTPLAAVSEEIARRTVTCIAPSKTFNLAGFATSGVVIPDRGIRDRYNAAISTLHVGGNNVFGGLAWEAACRGGADWLDELLVYLSDNVDFVEGFLAERLPEVKLTRPEGTYLLWLDFRGLGLEPKRLRTLLTRNARVAMNDGAAFGPGGVGFERMNVACPRSLLAEALARIETAVRAVIPRGYQVS